LIPTFFPHPADFHAWLEQHHENEKETVLGYFKKGSGKPSITWPESVDEALCFGWIDGIRRRIDDESYTIRFTPRKPRSIWSSVNVARMEALIAEGRVSPAGMKAFEARQENRSGIYSYEQRGVTLDEPYADQFRANNPAWEYFQSQPPSYRKVAIWWIVSAKTESTRLKRLNTLIEDSAAGRRIKQAASDPKR